MNSDVITCNIAVRQGCVFSTFLFCFFISELAAPFTYGIQVLPDIAKIYLLLFVDDIVRFSGTLKD